MARPSVEDLRRLRRDLVRPLLRVRQIREFRRRPIIGADLYAIGEVARWSGSGGNRQPCRFILVTDGSAIKKLVDAGMPQTRSLSTAAAVVVTVLPDDDERALTDTFDEGRAAERVMAAAHLLGLGSAVMRIRSDALPAVRELLRIPPDRVVRSMVALGHPTVEALKLKSTGGEARLPRNEVVYDGMWPDD